MKKGEMLNGISDSVREMVTQINRVGVSALMAYYAQKYPARDFQKSLRLVRATAKYGYAEAGRMFGVSRQMAHQTLKEFYRVALEMEVQRGAEM